MLAIPVMRSRVAPVLNWCSRVQIFPDDRAYEGPGQELVLAHLDPHQRLKFLREMGVTTLICGAVSPDLLHYGEQLGLRILCGVAGQVGEVLRSFWQNQLDQPHFRLPGCQGPRRYRAGWQAGKLGRGRGRDRRAGPPQGNGAGGLGVDHLGSCRCPACGYSLPHERGIPCSQATCPACGQTLQRA